MGRLSVFCRYQGFALVCPYFPRISACNTLKLSMPPSIRENLWTLWTSRTCNCRLPFGLFFTQPALTKIPTCSSVPALHCISSTQNVLLTCVGTAKAKQIKCRLFLENLHFLFEYMPLSSTALEMAVYQNVCAHDEP